MTVIGPFHQGELEMQQLAGEPHKAATAARMIQDTVPAGALQFLRQQSMIWIGIEDSSNYPWAFPLFGSPGFINPNKGERIEIELSENAPLPETWLNLLCVGKFIGCLAIELSSRRRLRINGVIKAIKQHQLHIEVQQAYPNCPKYIRKRELLNRPIEGVFRCLSRGTVLTEELGNIIKRSDTAFLASIGPNGSDVSHRGGPAGFIKVDSMNKITVPDYQGNGLFNSLGNFRINRSAGLTIAEFSQGYFLQLTGKINLLLDQEHPDTTSGGTNRYWELEVHEWHLFQLQPNYQWEDLDFSPYNPAT